MKIKSSLIFKCSTCTVPMAVSNKGTDNEVVAQVPLEFTRHAAGLVEAECPVCSTKIPRSQGTLARRKLVAEDMQRMNIPSQFWRAQLQGVQTPSRPMIENYVANFDTMAEQGAGLFLWGPPSRGKTSIGVVIAKEARARGYGAYFTSIYELREAIRNKAEFDEQATLSRCRDVDVLILDRLEPEDHGITHYFSTHDLKELILFRGSHLKVTIITTEENPSIRFSSLTKAISAYVVLFSVDGDDLGVGRKKQLQTILQPKKGT